VRNFETKNKVRQEKKSELIQQKEVALIICERYLKVELIEKDIEE